MYDRLFLPSKSLGPSVLTYSLHFYRMLYLCTVKDKTEKKNKQNNYTATKKQTDKKQNIKQKQQT